MSTTGKRRPGPFTPFRARSDTPEIISRVTTPVPGLPSKKIKSAVTSESRTRSPGKYRPPSRQQASYPDTPRKYLAKEKVDSPFAIAISAQLANSSSELDEELDPEHGLVDFQTVEDLDLSGEFDVRRLSSLSQSADDKVLVSVRIRPPGPDDNEAWNVNVDDNSLKLKDQHVRSGGSPPEFRFDNVLTGSANKPIYKVAAQAHVKAAMDGFNAVIFAYGQTASGKTFTLTGDDSEPGIIPRAMKDVFAYIRATPSREYLLRASYLEIYNEQIHDLLSPSVSRVPVGLQGIGADVVMTPLREEVVTSLKGVREVIERGERNRRTATTDWNERSSRSHSVFRLVIESRERADAINSAPELTPMPPTPGGSRLQARGGRSIQMSVLSLIDLAGSEKATSDKERTKEGKYINTSLLTLGTVIGTLAENASKNKSDHVPYRNSKLTRMLQPSLSGDARISVICTLNPSASAIGESTSTLGFAARVKKVHLCAKRKEIVDNEALIERYRKEIEELKQRLSEREVELPLKNRRLSAREKEDETRDKIDLNYRLRQLSKLILTSQSVGDGKRDDSRPSSPNKLDFDLSPYDLQQKLLGAMRRMESQTKQILSLEAALEARPLLPPDAPESEKDKLIAELQKTNRELEIVVQGYESNLGEPLRAVREDVEKEWFDKVAEEKKKREESEAWATELVRQLEREKQHRLKLEEEKLALIAFVSDIDPYLKSQERRKTGTSSLPRPVLGAAAVSVPEPRKKSVLGDHNSNTTLGSTQPPLKMDFTRAKGHLGFLEAVEEAEGEINFSQSPVRLGEGKENIAD